MRRQLPSWFSLTTLMSFVPVVDVEVGQVRTAILVMVDCTSQGEI